MTKNQHPDKFSRMKKQMRSTNRNLRGEYEMFEELGISFGTALIVLLALYFIVKWAVKNGIKEAYRDITGKVTTEDIEAEQICNELDLNEEEE